MDKSSIHYSPVISGVNSEDISFFIMRLPNLPEFVLSEVTEVLGDGIKIENTIMTKSETEKYVINLVNKSIINIEVANQFFMSI